MKFLFTKQSITSSHSQPKTSTVEQNQRKHSDELRSASLPPPHSLLTEKPTNAKKKADWILDGGYLPSSVIRTGIRYQLRQRLSSISSTSVSQSLETKLNYVRALRTRPIAIHTDAANQQHYEVGTGVLKACLGPRMKYSCCLYARGSETLAQAEGAMLDLYVQRAGLEDGMRILDLG